MAPLPAPFLNVQAKAESELTWRPDRPGIGLNHEFLVEDILHAEKHVHVFVHLAGHREIHRPVAVKASGDRVYIIIELSAGVMVLGLDVGNFHVGILQA